MTNPDPATPTEAEDPLAFTPVPRRNNRADGLNAEIQRNFISILACCGSPRRAAKAVGKAAFGFEQLRRADGAESFNRAWDAAVATFKEQEARRVAINAEIVKEEAAGWKPARGPWSNAGSRAHLRPAPEWTEADLETEDGPLLRLFDAILNKYYLKLEGERKARLAGRIAEADFYLRQITMLEVSLDVASGDGMELLKSFRRDGHDLLAVAETPMSMILDSARRSFWAEQGEPVRPPFPPEHLLHQLETCRIEPLECSWGGRPLTHQQQWDRFDEQHREDAKKQVEWEAQARRDYDRRRDSAADA